MTKESVQIREWVAERGKQAASGRIGHIAAISESGLRMTVALEKLMKNTVKMTEIQERLASSLGQTRGDRG